MDQPSIDDENSPGLAKLKFQGSGLEGFAGFFKGVGCKVWGSGLQVKRFMAAV
jgi:hypothetical protein